MCSWIIFLYKVPNSVNVKNNVLYIPPYNVDQIFTFEDAILTLHNEVINDVNVKGIYKISDIIDACFFVPFEFTQIQLTHDYSLFVRNTNSSTQMIYENPLFVCRTNSSIEIIAGFSPHDEQCILNLSDKLSLKVCIDE